MATEVEKSTKHILETTLQQAYVQDNGVTVRRSATIILEDGKFKICKFQLSSNNQYSLKDWMFLAVVAEEIKNQTLLGEGK